MGLVVKKGKDTPPVPEGVFQGVCYALYDIGTHFSEKWGKSAYQCIIIWELPDARIELEKDGKALNLPRAVSKKYTMSIGEKSNLRKDLQSWRGKSFTAEELDGFDITKLLGANCMIQIIHTTKDDKTYANISSITPLYKGMKKLEPENNIRYFSLAEHSELPPNTPDWITELVKDSAEWKRDQPIEPDNIPEPESEVPF